MSPGICTSYFASPSSQQSRAELQLLWSCAYIDHQVLPTTPQNGALFWGLSSAQPLLFMKLIETNLSLYLHSLSNLAKIGHQV